MVANSGEGFTMKKLPTTLTLSNQYAFGILHGFHQRSEKQYPKSNSLNTNLSNFQIQSCEWTKCINPEQAEHMTTDYNELVGVSFNSYVTYRCKFGFYFEHDREQESFKVKCVKKDNFIGFTYPIIWPKCVTGKDL